MKIKVLMIGPSSLGGISGLIKVLLPALAPRVDLSFLPTVQARQSAEAGKTSLRNLSLALSQYARFVKLMIGFRPDVIHLHTSQGLGWLKDTFYILCGKIFRAHIIVHINASDFNKFYAGTPRLMRSYTRWVMRLADAVLSVSAQWQSDIAQIVPKERVHIYFNCIDVKAIPTHEPSPSNDDIHALFLGAVGDRKGVPELLDAMSRLKSRHIPLTLWLAGSEEKAGDLERIQTLISELHLEDVCELTGDVREQRKTSLLRSASLFVLPTHNEGLPVALAEGMAAGLPVVSTPVGGIPEIIHDGYNGFLVPPGDADALADKLDILVRDPQLRRTMGSRNREIAEQVLDVGDYVVRLQKLYESIV